MSSRRSDSFSHGEILDLLVRNDDSLQRFVWESSRNLVKLEFDVLDYVTVQKARMGIGDVINDAISAISYVADLSRYDKILLFIHPLEYGEPGCEAYLGPVSWHTPNGTFELGAAWLSGYDMSCVEKGRIAHEFGHTFGFMHSYTVTCTKEPPLPASLIDPTDKNDSCRIYYMCNVDCTEVDPADSVIIANDDWDMLGGDHLDRYENLFPLHYQAAWQAHAGWLREDQVAVAGGSGRYWLTTLESLDPWPKAVRVPLGFDPRGEPYSYLLQTRVFSPWSLAFVETADRCQVDVRLNGNPFSGRGDHLAGEPPFDTFFFYTQPTYLGAEEPVHGESVVRRETPFWDPYRGIRMEIVNCMEMNEGIAIQVSIDYSRLRAEPPIVARFDAGETVGTERTITVTNRGAVEVTMGSVAIGGRHPGAFSLGADRCSRAVLAPDDSCEVGVRYVARVRNRDHHAIVKLPNDDRLAPQLSVSLLGQAKPERAREAALSQGVQHRD